MFSKEEEQELQKYIIFSAKLFHDLVKLTLKKLAYEYAVSVHKKYQNYMKKSKWQKIG